MMEGWAWKKGYWYRNVGMKERDGCRQGGLREGCWNRGQGGTVEREDEGKELKERMKGGS